MKKIISTTLVFAISIFAGSLFAQQISSEQRIAFQTDNIETFKKAFPKEDYDKCLGEKKYQLQSFGVQCKIRQKKYF
ncbi:hypothetical protein [Chryseobacterium proteolyticum]|uniref:hypothetical protein n=1 Tax=Chryseobacterium proteolyticum TaxID=118127 RepID=UPI003983B37B